MADAWTGINVEEVTSQLDNFADTTQTIIHNYSTMFDLFNDELYVTWGSENAVKYNTQLIKLFEYKRTLCELRNKILQAASGAASFMAKHNGTEFNYSVGYMMYGGSIKNLKDEINGVKGMNIPLAKMALESFQDGCNEVMNQLDELPVSFGLYDPSGELQATYKALIKDTVSKFKDDFIHARDYVSDAFEEETLQLEVGKAEAEEELSGYINPTTDEGTPMNPPETEEPSTGQDTTDDLYEDIMKYIEENPDWFKTWIDGKPSLIDPIDPGYPIIWRPDYYCITCKPIIYLYPETETQVEVKLGHPEKLTTTYPKYNGGWRVTAKPNGDLIDAKGRNYYSLYWEGINANRYMTDEGFVVEGSKVESFLEEKLALLGLNEREAEEFIIYWLPKLEANKYNYIRFETKEEIDKDMPLEVSGNPETVIRVLMDYKGLDAPVEVKEQTIVTPERKGFTVVEWGGSLIK